ncbi:MULTISPECIES: DUF4293 domain-containing protein [Porphyromonas]|uniref:DUF4293 domain-containing protein n=1 Tax=Porphyromonas TaxID=836 RepID=UPI00051DB5F0|nr:MULTISPECIES: DUF4293 domain-containing protein [Porphyromonas]KGL52353.1 hypothetical protein HQ29_05380 [Porphyromonas canoris]KGN70501.1 hypothetical protein JT26_03295 [Porphyromonas sp. COT-108 OH1349]
MIQRIQTIYLLVASILMAILSFIPVATVNLSGDIFLLDGTGFMSLDESLFEAKWGLLFLLILSALIPMIAIFLYNRRVLQMRLTMFSALITLGMIGAFLFYGYQALGGTLEGFKPTYAFSFPIVAVILELLAYRGIAIDHRTIKYADRLR